MVHNETSSIGSELREQLSQNKNLDKFFNIMQTYSK
jgi:hypothetical protein